jgi:type III restriction enzyme
VFESDSVVSVQEDVLRGLKPKDMLKLVFNASSPGEIEYFVRPSDRRELAFALKTSGRPFALVKIGDISGWLKDELDGYNVTDRHEDESYFERLNAPDSEVNILMGSRSFYEGWDSEAVDSIQNTAHRRFPDLRVRSALYAVYCLLHALRRSAGA